MSLQGKRVAVLVEQQYQEMEVWYPVYRLREAGCAVELVGPEAGKTYASKLGYPAKATLAAPDAKAANFDAVVIPGGFSPDYIRRSAHMLQLVRDRWSIEGWHWIRDTQLHEDAHRYRGNGASVMATLRTAALFSSSEGSGIRASSQPFSRVK